MTKDTFYKLIDGITSGDLREAIADSALTNANDTMKERGYQPVDSVYLPWGDKTGEFWDMAIATATMILDCPRDYYPELFDKR